MRVSWFPKGLETGENPYWTQLRLSLEGLGVEFDTSLGFGRRWLWKRRNEVQVLHFHFIQGFYAYEWTQARLRWVMRLARNLLLARALGYRIVFTLHDLKPTHPLQPEWVDYLGHWTAANLADCVIVHYQSARKSLAERFGRRRNVCAMPHPSFIGICPNTISQGEARSHLGLMECQTVLVFFGGIRPNKGIETLISAFGKIPGDDLRLIIAGKPYPPATYIQGLSDQAKCDARVRIAAEFIPNDQVQLYLNAANVVVLPFKEILSSSSTHLAMSFGRAVVAPAMGSLVDLLTPGAGILYDPTDPDGLYQALQRCHSLDLESMGRKAYERAAEFTFNDFAKKTLDAYQSIAR